MWPLMPVPVDPDVSAQLAVLCAVSIIFVLGVLAVLLGRLTRNRREIFKVTCPENHGRALVIMHQSPDGAGYDAVSHCSRWHDGRLDCGQRCLSQVA